MFFNSVERISVPPLSCTQPQISLFGRGGQIPAKRSDLALIPHVLR